MVLVMVCYIVHWERCGDRCLQQVVSECDGEGLRAASGGWVEAFDSSIGSGARHSPVTRGGDGARLWTLAWRTGRDSVLVSALCGRLW